MRRTEFYEIAVQKGFYGLEKSGLFGKKDNVRKYWEDISIKQSVAYAVHEILARKEKMRIVDLGCGSGEGYELLTHIPPVISKTEISTHFLLDRTRISDYTGIDVSPAMVEQGRKNYQGLDHIHFVQADLAKGWPLSGSAPFDLYFSSYASLSHLELPELEHLICQICGHIEDTGYLVLDLHGRYSPEWPSYWAKDNTVSLPYTMAYLLPQGKRIPENIEWFNVIFWSGEEVKSFLQSLAQRTNREIVTLNLRDRSVFVGRHMDTQLFKGVPHELRYQINRLFDRDYRGAIDKLQVDISYLKENADSFPLAWNRIKLYYDQWLTIISLLAALMQGAIDRVKEIQATSREPLSSELDMLIWLYRNVDRFPVVDFWASVMGPQVACVLRNLEQSLPEGLGCGHGLFCIAKISQP